MNLVKKNIKISFFAFLQVLVSFACSYFISKSLGFGNKLDIYYLSIGIYMFNLSIITNSIQAVLAPELINSQDENFKYKSFLNIIIIIITYSLVFLLFSKQIINLLFFNLLSSSSFDLVFKVQIIFLIALIIKTINIVGVSLLQRNENYVSINLSLVIASCVFFFIIYILKSENFLFLCSIGFLVRNILEFILISIRVLDFSQLLKVQIDFKSLKKLFADCRIFIFGQLFYKTEDLLDKYISSFLVEGFLSFTSFIKTIFSALSNILINSYIIQSLSYFSKNKKNLKKSLEYLKKRIYILFLISLAIVIGNALLGNYVFTLLFNNKFSPELTKYISFTLSVSSIIIFFIPLNAIYQNLLLSLTLHKKIVFLDSISYAISVVLKIVLSIKFGVHGFLIAFVISLLIKNFIKSIAIIKLKNNYK